VGCCGASDTWRDALQSVGDWHGGRRGTVLQGGGHDTEGYLGINARTCGVVNE
jgi:hypothetical protein